MRALITGVTGQDGSYLAELLLAKGSEVHGVVRRTSTPPYVPEGVIVHRGDLTDAGSLVRAVEDAAPDEVYNLAAISDARQSVVLPYVTMDVTGLGAMRLFDAVEGRGIRVFHASSVLQDEPHPYGLAKGLAHRAAAMYRGRGAWIATGIMHNHESPRHGPNFLVRKVTTGVAAIVAGEADTITLGDLNGRRDWGWAPDYVEAMWRTLQEADPADHVMSTGVTHTVREVCEVAFGYVGLDWRKYVQHGPDGPDLYLAPQAPEYVRPTVTFEEMIVNILRADLCRPS